MRMDNHSASLAKPEIGQPAPELVIDSWAQGQPVTLSELLGEVVLIEVFQLNCPGCFVHALPEVLAFDQQYRQSGLTVIGLATAFEDFDINTLNNLHAFLQTNQLIGEPLRQLEKAGFLDDKHQLPYQITFRIAMDKLVKNNCPVTEDSIRQFILQQIPDFDQQNWSDERRQTIIEQASNYLENKCWSPQTFENYQLQGTPSSILIDKQGILQDISFGQVNQLKPKIETLLQQSFL